MPLQLPQIYSVAHPEQFKLHLACWNQIQQPLDVFVRSREEWDGWNRWRGKRDDFSRPFIFALIDFYHERDTWLFGGAYRVVSRKPVNDAASYVIERLPDAEPYVGRLKLSFKRPARAKAVNFEHHYSLLSVAEVLRSPYSGESFPGYDAIDLPFAALEAIVVAQRADWRAALENAKGVYLITDTKTGKRYVGSAYGERGIWSRWECYAGTGHGYNDELTRILKTQGMEYAEPVNEFETPGGLSLLSSVL